MVFFFPGKQRDESFILDILPQNGRKNTFEFENYFEFSTKNWVLTYSLRIKF